MFTTRRLSLPLIDQGQALKHVTHNEAISQLDALVHLSVISAVTRPPSVSIDGEMYLVARPSSHEFATRDDMIAIYQNDGFNFVPPVAGWRCFLQDRKIFLTFDGLIWSETLGVPNRALQFGINTTADEVNKFAVNSSDILFTATAPADGGSGDLRIKLNKSAVSNTSSILYQNNWSGRAEMGLMGDDQFRFKVSSQGSDWKEAMVVDPATARVQFSSDITAPRLSFTQLLDTPTLGADGPLTLRFQRARGAASNIKAAVSSQDMLGQVVGCAYDGRQFANAAAISFSVDNTPSSDGFAAGRITFSTTSNVSGLRERLAVDAAGVLQPAQDNMYALGQSTKRWTQIYSIMGVSAVSDEREKTDIEPIAEGLKLIRALQPVSYRWKVAQRKFGTGDDCIDEPGRRKHLGLIAQQVKAVLDEQLFDCGLYTYDQDADRHGLRYDQLLAPLIKAIQELDARYEDLSRRLTTIGH